MKIKSKILGTAIVMAMATTTGTALAEAGANSNFGKLDSDSNGQINKEEAKAMPALEANFAAVDQNSDGQVSEREYLVAIGVSPAPQKSGEGTSTY